MIVCEKLRELEEIVIYEDGRMMKKNSTTPVKAKLLGLGVINYFSGETYGIIPPKANAYFIGPADFLHQEELPIAYFLKE